VAGIGVNLAAGGLLGNSVPPDLDPGVPAKVGARAAAQNMDAGFLSSWAELNLTLLIFAFGVVALLLFYWIVRSNRDTPMLLRVYVILILIFGTLLIVSSAYTTEQVAPVVGFFGTIAGYLLGRGDRHDELDR
jgi:CHASE2 domain-containing sensor protein